MEENKLIKAMIRTGDKLLSGTNRNMYNEVNELFINPVFRQQGCRLDTRRNTLVALFYRRADFLEFNLVRDIYHLLGGSKTDNRQFNNFKSAIIIPMNCSNLEYVIDNLKNIIVSDYAIQMASSIYNSYMNNIVGMSYIDRDLAGEMDIIVDYCSYILHLLMYEAVTVYIPAGFDDSQDNTDFEDSLILPARMLSDIIIHLQNKLFDDNSKDKRLTQPRRTLGDDILKSLESPMDDITKLANNNLQNILGVLQNK